MKFNQKNNLYEHLYSPNQATRQTETDYILYLVNVDVSASTEAFLETACYEEGFSRGRNVNINQIKVVFLTEFHFELVYRSTYEYT